jgi:raffinose/stachyose/melibiose transport system permease protein
VALVADTPPRAEHAGRLRRAWHRDSLGERLVTAVVFLVPALTLFTLFVMLPIGEAAYYSVFRWDGYGAPTQFVGARNFEALLGQSTFRTAMANTALIIAASLAIQLPLALWMALILSERIRGAVLFRAVFFLPYILAEVATGLIWKFVYDGQYGLAAGVTGALGAEPVFLLGDRDLAIYAVIAVVVWKFFGFHMMIYIAGLQAISDEILDSAKVDGASWWETARHIRIPMILPVIRLSVFFSILGALQIFDLVWALTRGGPANASHTVVTYLYDFGIVRMSIGFGSAVGVVLFAICVAFAFSYRRAFMRYD